MPMEKIASNCWLDGPFMLPNRGEGKFSSKDSDVVKAATSITAEVHKQRLLLYGEDGCTQEDFHRARMLATELFIRNQQIDAAQLDRQRAQLAQQRAQQATEQAQRQAKQAQQQAQQYLFHCEIGLMQIRSEHVPRHVPSPRPPTTPAPRRCLHHGRRRRLYDDVEEISSDSSVPPPVTKKVKRVIVHIQIHTFGIEALGVHYHANNDVIHRRFKDLYQIDLGMLVDCRKPFKYPRCARKHNGHHDEFVRNLVDNPEFSGWLYNVKQDLLWQSRRWCSDSMTSISSSRTTSAELFHIGVFLQAGQQTQRRMQLDPAEHL